MVIGLLWIVGVYGSCIILLHVIHFGYLRNSGSKPVHFVLITRNSQAQIEWYVRSLFFVMWLKGKDMAMTICDQDSTDDTLAIVERLRNERNKQIRMWPSSSSIDALLEEHDSEPVIVVRLINEKELIKIPLPH